MMNERLNWEECKAFAKNTPGLEHTELRELSELPKDKYSASSFDQSDKTSGMVLSSMIGNDGRLTVYKRKKLCHVLGIGSSGSGKSQGMILNALMNATGNESYIVADPKGELSRAAYNLLTKKYGKDNVKILNFLTPEHSEIRVNEFEIYAREWVNAKDRNKEAIRNQLVSKIRKYVETVFPIPLEASKDTSWYTTGRQFLLAIVIGLYEDLSLTKTEARKTKRRKAEPEEITWENVSRIFHSFSWNEGGYRGSGLKDGGFFLSRDKETSVAYSLAQSVIFNATSTMANYFGFSEMYLRTVTDPKILKVSSGNNYDILSMGKRPQVLFLVYDLSDISIREYVNMVCASFVNALLESTHKDGTPLRTPVILLLDEFPTLKSNPIYPNVLATGRGSNIFLSLICQSISQLKARYPEEWGAMIENCDLTIYQGSNDVSSAEYFAKELGQTTVPDPCAFLQNHFSLMTVPVVSIDKLMHRLDSGEVFIKVHHEQPIHGHFSFYYQTDEYRQYPVTDINSFCYHGASPKEYDVSWMKETEDDDEDDDDDIASSFSNALRRRSSKSNTSYDAEKGGENDDDDENEEENDDDELERLLEEISQEIYYVYVITKTEAHTVDGNSDLAAQSTGHSKEEFVRLIDAREPVSENDDNDSAKEIAAKITSLGYTSIVTQSSDIYCFDDLDLQNEEAFENVCMNWIERIVSINEKQTREEALIIAQGLANNSKTNNASANEIAVFDRVAHEFDIATDAEYNILRKQIFEEE